MNILHLVLCYYPSQAGGPANAIYWLNSSLNSNCFSVDVISTRLGLPERIDFKVYHENHNASFIKGKRLAYFYECLKKIKNAQIVQFSSLFFLPTLPILMVAIISGKSVVVSTRGELYKAAISQKEFRKKIYLKLFRSFQNSINFHATNDFEARLIREYFPSAKSICEIPNYIKLPKKLDLDVKSEFTFVGRINPIKNIELIIAAMIQIHEFHPNVKLNIVGAASLDYEKSYQRSLQVQIEESGLGNTVFFRGHIEGDLKNKIVASSKALILPSKSENFGNVILEALAQGTPVIASQNTPWKLLEQYKSGMWVGSNINELKNAMLKILELDKTTYQQMRKNAYELCKSKFDIKENIKVWEEYYKKI